MASKRPGRAILLVACVCMCLVGMQTLFVPAPQTAPLAGHDATAAAYAALPAMTLLASDAADATYGVEVRRWHSVLVPLTTLVVPAVAFGSFVLYAMTEDFGWQLIPGSKKGLEAQANWRKHPAFADTKDPMYGLVDKDDFEKGLAEAWEKAKPKGSTVTVEDKLKQLSTQNNPHWIGTKTASRSA